VLRILFVVVFCLLGNVLLDVVQAILDGTIYYWPFRAVERIGNQYRAEFEMFNIVPVQIEVSLKCYFLRSKNGEKWTIE